MEEGLDHPKEPALVHIAHAILKHDTPVRSKPISSFMAYTNETKTRMKSLGLCQGCETTSIHVGHDAPESNQRLLT